MQFHTKRRDLTILPNNYELLSDQNLLLTNELKLPTFVYNSTILIKRMAWFIKERKIKKVFYPVFPPDQNANEVLHWLYSQGEGEPQ